MAIATASEHEESVSASPGARFLPDVADRGTLASIDDKPSDWFSPLLSWTLLQCGLAIAASSTPALLTRRYGAPAGQRAALGLALAFGVQYGCLLRAVRQAGPQARGPDIADVLTLSRATGASMLAAVVCSGVRDRSGLAGRLAWAALLWGETVSDWLDGPLARRRGPTRLGATLDMESDSWLTLTAALAAVTWGDLPPVLAVAPALRYPMHRRADPPSGSVSRSWWARTIGQAQMAVITAALCPWPVHHLRKTARRVAPVVAAASLASLALQRARHVKTSLQKGRTEQVP